jgi:hypothetical protein
MVIIRNPAGARASRAVAVKLSVVAQMVDGKRYAGRR